MFVAIDPHVRRFPELKRLDMGWVMYPNPLRGDWTKQRIFKVRNDRLVDEGAFADANASTLTFSFGGWQHGREARVERDRRAERGVGEQQHGESQE